MKESSILLMKEKLSDLYGEKTCYYTVVLESLEKEDVSFIVLNLLVSDDNPGDLDILLIHDDYGKVKRILSYHKFSFYTLYETDQFLWNKYIPGIGFVQIHCYKKFSFNGHDFLGNIQLYEQLSDNKVFNFYVFLIESFFKGKRRDRQYEEYLKLSSIEEVQDFSRTIGVQGEKICSSMIRAYETHELTTRTTSFRTKLVKMRRVLKRLLIGSDDKVLFIGADGSGKSSIIEGVFEVFSKGGIYPQKMYLGLSDSRFNKKTNEELSHSENCSKDAVLINKTVIFKNLFRNIKLVLYWLEYNCKFIVRTSIPRSAKTVYLIDRCYIDLLRFYPSSFAKWLILKMSLYPNKVVYLTGDKNILYNRKKEYSEAAYYDIFGFYEQISMLFKKKHGIQFKTIDTTKLSLKESVFIVCDFIVE